MDTLTKNLTAYLTYNDPAVLPIKQKGDGFMTEIKIEKDKLIPCVPTRDLVVFEDMTVNFEVARGFTINAVKKAMNGDG